MRHGRNLPAENQPMAADEGTPGLEPGDPEPGDPEPGDPEPGDLDHPGEPACWAHLVCPACGAMISEGHRDGCQWDEAAGGS